MMTQGQISFHIKTINATFQKSKTILFEQNAENFERPNCNFQVPIQKVEIMYEGL